MKVPQPRKLKSGTWFIQMRLNGVSVPVSAPTKTECIYQAQLIKSEYKAGKRHITRSNITLPQAIEKYTAARKNVLSPATIRNYKWVADHQFLTVQDIPLAKIKNWQELIDMEAAHYSPKTLKTTWHMVSAVLSENDIPKPKVKLPLVMRKDKPYLNPDEVKVFVKALLGEPCEIAALLGLHSLRLAEILALTWENVDLKNKLIKVRATMVKDEHNKTVFREVTKTKASRRDVPIMIPELLTALKAVPQSKRTGLVCTHNPSGLLKQINRVCKNNGLPEIGVHGLRRSFASLAFSAQVRMTEREVMEIGGWDDAATVHKIYEQISKKQLETASAKMGSFFSENQNANESANEVSKNTVKST